MPKAKNQAAAQLGRLGGKARAKKLTATERSESARHAVMVRWQKHRKRLKLAS